MADNKNNRALFGGFTRLRNFPLDPTSIFNSTKELEDYLKYNKTAYEGQIVFNLQTRTAHVIVYTENEQGERALSIKYIATSNSGKIEDLDTLQVSIDNINNNIDIIEKKLDNLSSSEEFQKKLDDLKSEILGGELSANLDSIKEVVEKIQTQGVDITSLIGRLDTHETQFTTLVKRLDDHEQEFIEVNKLVQDNKKDVSELKEYAEKTYVQIFDLEKRVSEIFGFDVDDKTPNFIDSIKEINDWITENKDVLSQLQAVSKTVDELDEKLDRTDAALRELISQLTSRLSNLESSNALLNNKVAGIDNQISNINNQLQINSNAVLNLTNDVQAVKTTSASNAELIRQLSAIVEAIKGNYITRENLNDALAGVDIGGIEKTIILPFYYNDNESISYYSRSDEIIPKDAIIKSLELEITAPTTEIIYVYPENSDNSRLAVLQKYEPNNPSLIEDEKVLLYDSAIDTEVITTPDELPETFIFKGINYHVVNETGVKLRIEVENFKGCQGIAYLKYVKPSK